MSEEKQQPSFVSSSAGASSSDKSSADKSADKKTSEGKEEKKKEPANLKQQLEELKKQKDEYLACWQRERADFLNYKRDEAERIKEILKYTNIELILKLLPILDNFRKAARQNSLPENLNGQEKEKVNQVIQGFLQIKTQLQDFLRNQGIEEMSVIGEKFDPNLHEAIEEVELEDKDSGTVVEEIRKGYLIEGNVLRPAKVKIIK